MPSRLTFVKHGDERVILLHQGVIGYGSNRQTWSICLEIFPRVILTISFLSAYFAVLLHYQAQQTVDRNRKLIFDAVTTGLILGLGLNFFEAFRELAKTVRWRILLDRPFKRREVDLILGAESLMKVLRMMTESGRKPLVLTTCLLWLVINIGAQVQVAVLPLYGSLQSGFDSTGTTVSAGSVSVPRLDCFYQNGMTECGKDHLLDPTIAHTYGQAGNFRGQNCTYDSLEDIKNGAQTCPYFRNDRHEFAVRYAESNPIDLIGAYPYYGADRVVTVAATCDGQTPSAPTPADGSDGPSSEFVWNFENSTGIYDISIPRSSLAELSTTYVWNDTNLPPDATTQACGPRCITLYALRDMRNETVQQWSLFRCDVTVSTVSNATDPVHVLSDDVARIAAASIALSGRWRWLMGNDHKANHSLPDGRQFQLYQHPAYWAAELDDTPEEVGALMAEFAAAALATMAQRNPTTLVSGNLPTLGYQLDMEWANASIVAASILTVHLLLILLKIWLARPVPVLEDSYLAMAPLLVELSSDSLPEEKSDDDTQLPDMERQQTNCRKPDRADKNP